MKRLRLVFSFLRPLRWYVALALAVSTGLTVLGLVPPLLLKAVIDRVIGKNEWNLMLVILIVALGVALCTAVMGYFSNLVINYIGRKFVFVLRNSLYKTILHHSFSFFEETGPGRLISRLMEDTALVQRMISANSVMLVNDAVAFLFCAGILVYLKWELGLVVLGMVPMYLFNHHFFVKRIEKKNREMLDYREKVVATLEERISGTRLVKAFSREEAESEIMRERLDEVVRLASESTRYSTAFTGMASSITSLGNAFLYSLGCFLVLTEWMTYGEVMAFMAYLTRLLQSALQFTQVTGEIQETMVSIDRIQEVLEKPVQVVSRPGAPDLPPVRGDIRFENVAFSYTPGQPVINDFTLDIPAGKLVALVGKSGCGKSTLTSLLLRFYEPQQGRILVDGHDLSEVSLRSLRIQIGQVLQQPFLFDGTIRENILYGDPGAGEERMREAAGVANIDRWIESLPDQYDTILGEDGLRPSLGQKQQLSIARAILTNPAILVLDEATSSLDAESEAMIQKAFENVLRNRTSLVVAHRLSTIRNADLIVVMDRGRILEVGSHDELMAVPEGQYRDYYLRQSQCVLNPPEYQEEDGEQ